MTTLICIRHCQVGSRHFGFGEELPPDLIRRELIDEWLDQGWLKEYDAAERPSLYRLFARFTGATPEQPLTREQIEKFCLPK